jgi:hypothetical protein
MLNIDNKAISEFLDAADLVLNSNTFLLSYMPAYPDDVKSSLETYLTSKSFQAEIIKQDHDREWYNMQMFDEAINGYVAYNCNLLKPDFQLKLLKLPIETKQYLIGILMADHTVGNFFSPYQTTKSRQAAEKLVDAFLESIMDDDQLHTFSIVPDFLFNAGINLERNENTIHYFEGETACDSATLFCLPQRHFLLLTNGID